MLAINRMMISNLIANKMELSRLKNTLNFFVLKKLNNHRKASPLKRGEFFIDDQTSEYLRGDFGLTKKFSYKPAFLEYVGIITRKKLSETCEVSLDIESFEVRILKGTKAKYLDDKLNSHFILSEDKIQFRFKLL